MARILITGGSGRLGRALLAVAPEMFAPTHATLDILDRVGCFDLIQGYKPDLIIHCAAFVNAARAESERDQCWNVNVEGTRNLVHAARGRRFVYVSTDYVFSGDKGNYSERDTPAPVNFYGLSKLAGELVTGEHPNTLVIRPAVRADPPWRFERAFVDQFTSCDFASERAPQIMRAALSDFTGVLHIGGKRRSIYRMALACSPQVGRMRLDELKGLKLPRDTSLDSGLWHSLFAA